VVPDADIYVGDIYPWAGEFRTINVFKNETALNGYPLEFMDHESINSHLTWTLSRMNKAEWYSFNIDDQAHHLARFMSEIWRAHAFREGNTRTTLAFLGEFAKYKGFPLLTSLLIKHTAYMRKALVASVFEDEVLEKKRNYTYLEKILKDAILKGNLK
jgi:cell filamentation protein